MQKQVLDPMMMKEAADFIEGIMDGIDQKIASGNADPAADQMADQVKDIFRGLEDKCNTPEKKRTADAAKNIAFRSMWNAELNQPVPGVTITSSGVLACLQHLFNLIKPKVRKGSPSPMQQQNQMGNMQRFNQCEGDKTDRCRQMI